MLYSLPFDVPRLGLTRVSGTSRGEGKMWGYFAGFARKIPPRVHLTLAIPTEPLTLGALALAAGALVVLFLLIVLVESVVLQLMNWGSLGRSLWGAFWMNLASTLVGFTTLSLVPALGLWGLLIAWALSVLIEALVLMRLRRGETRSNWQVSLVAVPRQ